MIDTTLKEELLNLAHIEIALEKKGGPEKAGKLFEKVIEKPDTILTSLGLPSTPYYQTLLNFNAVPWDKELDDLIGLLKREAESRKKESSKTALEILIEAQKTNRDPMFVLPMIGVPVHIYTLFVYNHILMYVQDDFEHILNELKLVNDDTMLDSIGRMSFETNWLSNAEETISALEARGLKYIRQYAMDSIDHLKEFGFKINVELQ